MFTVIDKYETVYGEFGIGHVDPSQTIHRQIQISSGFDKMY